MLGLASPPNGTVTLRRDDFWAASRAASEAVNGAVLRDDMLFPAKVELSRNVA